ILAGASSPVLLNPCRQQEEFRMAHWTNATILISASVLAWQLCNGSRLRAAEAPGKTKIRIATASPSLSYLPIYAAVKKGFFARRGFDVQLIQMSASLTAPA